MIGREHPRLAPRVTAVTSRSPPSRSAGASRRPAASCRCQCTSERWHGTWCAISRACARCVPEIRDSALRIAHGESVGRSMLLAGSLSGSCKKMSILLVLSEKQTRAGVVGSYWVAVHPKHGSCDRCHDHHGPTLDSLCWRGRRARASRSESAVMCTSCTRRGRGYRQRRAQLTWSPTRSRLSQGRGESSDSFSCILATRACRHIVLRVHSTV